MSCAVKDCQEGDDLKRDPCSVCGNLVHHICAIGVFEVSDSALNESLSCVSLIYPNAPVPSSENPPPLQSFENRDSSVVEPVTKRRRTGAVSKQRKGAFPGKTIRIAASTAESNPPYDGLIQIAPPASPLSDLGVPASLKHFRKEGSTDDVWDLVHTLEKPYRKRNPWKPSRQLYCNLCILCCQDVQARTRTNRYSWEVALRNTKNASNAKDHIKSKHADHPLAKLAEQKTTQRAKNDVVRAEAGAQAVLDLTVDHEIDSAATRSTTSASVSMTAAKTTKRFFRASEKTLNVLISKWMISQGMSYTACASESFHDIIRAATGNPTFPMLSRDKHDRLLNGQFQLFCDLVGELLASEFQKACQLKFLNLIHDICTSCGKNSIIGASVAFIDSLWRFRFIAMLASVKNEGHNAHLVAKVIESGFKEDCSMHLLNLCIGYSIGLKDNVQTVTVWNDSTNSWDKVVTTVTPGGSFDEGGDVIQKLRNLNNYFKSPKQRNALAKIQEALTYPELDPMTDKDARVAYTCKVIRRSVVNYSAYEAYFQSTKDSSSVWASLTAKDWMLAVEMEAVTNFVASLALVETQSENLVSSYMVVFRRLAENKLKSFKFEAMAIEPPRSKYANEESHRRFVRTQEQLSQGAKTCLRRTLLQLQARFPKVMKEAITCVPLDPRTKSSAKKIAAVGDIPRRAEKTIYKGGIDFLRGGH
ncbi:hypothetical protein PF010_g25004 [Phytophthora fragariae]|uniref:Uncharacterized protein n=1 Tax=Phytophthora fragariae TaxID=53985 RepID=A0A6G0K0Y7_9STRA|nr:hypothetical protein PF010_g25004 [Phytophthora fragariae]